MPGNNSKAQKTPRLSNLLYDKNKKDQIFGQNLQDFPSNLNPYVIFLLSFIGSTQ